MCFCHVPVVWRRWWENLSSESVLNCSLVELRLGRVYTIGLHHPIASRIWRAPCNIEVGDKCTKGRFTRARENSIAVFSFLFGAYFTIAGGAAYISPGVGCTRAVWVYYLLSKNIFCGISHSRSDNCNCCSNCSNGLAV